MLLEREPLVAAAMIAAEATQEERGFRQRDVRFFLELFSNWLGATTGSATLGVHNAQMKRALDLYTAVGWAKRTARNPPRYRLTPDGLLELLQRLVKRRNLSRLDEFFLVFHFLDTYGDRLRRLLATSRSAKLGSGFDAVVADLLDARRLVAREREMVAREVERLTIRMEEAQQTVVLAKRLLREKGALADVVNEVELRFPYDLNSQKPLSEALAGLPVTWQRMELEAVPAQRARTLWSPTRSLLQSYDQVLRTLVPEKPRSGSTRP